MKEICEWQGRGKGGGALVGVERAHDPADAMRVLDMAALDHDGLVRRGRCSRSGCSGNGHRNGPLLDLALRLLRAARRRLRRRRGAGLCRRRRLRARASAGRRGGRVARVTHGGGEAVDGWAGELVLRAEDAEEVVAYETGIGVLVRARERDGAGRCAGARAANTDLRAGGVVLRTTNNIGEVQADDLVANEVVSRCKVVRDGCGERAAVEDVLLEPRRAVRFLAFLFDFEPLGVARVEFVASCAFALGQVSKHRASVMGPLKGARKVTLVLSFIAEVRSYRS